MITLLKIGGNIVDDGGALHRFLASFSTIPGKKILVHGGGKKATSLADKLGVETKMVDGRRITCSESLEIVTMVYAGLINKSIVAALSSLDCPSLGLTGVDAGIISAQKRNSVPIDFGFVGDIIQVRAEKINSFLDSGLSLVFAPLVADQTGQLLNINADTMAASLAISLSQREEVRLMYCFEQKGVLTKEGGKESVMAAITKEEMTFLVGQEIIHSGMIPKLDEAFRAANSSVARVVVGHAEDVQFLLEGKKGTLITPNSTL